jgi:hypothetical protein
MDWGPAEVHDFVPYSVCAILYTSLCLTIIYIAPNLFFPVFRYIFIIISENVSNKHFRSTHHHVMPRSKNAWNYTSLPQYAFMARWSVKKSRDLDETDLFMAGANTLYHDRGARV